MKRAWQILYLALWFSSQKKIFSTQSFLFGLFIFSMTAMGAEHLLYPGLVLPLETVEISSESDGFIGEIFVHIGQKIARDGKLFTIESADPLHKFMPFVTSSPRAGLVAKIDLKKGARISRGKPVITIIDPENIKIQIEIPAWELRLIQIGLSGEFLLPEGKSIPVRVEAISPLANALGTVEGVLSPLKPSPDLLPGRVGQAKFTITSLTLPSPRTDKP
ncbi:MAG: HlyD family efflux transporter periplasmic adaptor subunit [Oligoflexales bacterium]|nr:HlyD family efflux transporter periplasmic adaptor subunit [Oligoflexales bacterium]